MGLYHQAGGEKKHLGNPNEFGAGNAPASLEVMEKSNSNRMKKICFSILLLLAESCFVLAQCRKKSQQLSAPSNADPGDL